MDTKYSVMPINNNEVNESILDTHNLFEALKKVEEQYQKTNTKCVIVSYDARFRPTDIKMGPD
jgi:hypothetical protein